MRLISRAKNRNLISGYEVHHVIPKCVGGSNDSNNKVKLTPEEHYVAHQLLVKIYNNPKLVYAAVMMIPTNKFHNNGKGRNNKLYGWLKRRFSNICKQRIKEKNGSFGTMWITDGNTPKKIKKTDLIPIGYVKGRTIKIEIIKKSRKEKKISDSVALELLRDYESGMSMSDILIKYQRKSEQSVTTFLRKRFPNRKTFLPKMRTKSLKH